MSKRIGLVRDAKSKGQAEVQTDRRDACGGCGLSHGCRTCLSSGGKIVSSVQNTIGAKPGDLVVIDMRTANIWKGAALFYIFPTILLLAGAAIGSAIGSTGLAIFLGLGFLMSGMILIRWISNTQAGKKLLIPKIVKIIERRASKSKRSEFDLKTANKAC